MINRAFLDGSDGNESTRKAGDMGSISAVRKIPALFITARTWKQPRCPSADKWIRKLWYIHTMEYH